jgi:RimJ/RimL family protein N-acetyltransferase
MTSYYEVVPAHRRLEIGYTWLGSAYWRTGHNTEAKLLLLTRAFETLGARRVSWRTDIRNERSQQAIERLGATREGVFRAHLQRPDGTIRDSVYYALTEAEWPAVRDRLRARLSRG